jgi:ribosomal protein S18 acetylase RimI-like enzyme
MNKTPEFQVKPWDARCSRAEMLEITQSYWKHLKATWELNEEDLGLYSGDKTDLSQNVLRFEDSEGNKVGFVGMRKFHGETILEYAIRAEYFSSTLPQVLIEACIGFAKNKGIQNLLFHTFGPLAKPFDDVMQEKGKKIFQYGIRMFLQDVEALNMPETPQGITFRKIPKLDDYSHYTAVFNAANQNSFGFHPHSVEETMKEIENLRQRRDHYDHWFAYDHDVLVGICDVLVYSGHKGYIYHLAVLPAFQHRGIGSKLLGLAIKSLHNMNYMSIELGVYLSNESALRLYENLGFKPGFMKEKVYKIL